MSRHVFVSLVFLLAGSEWGFAQPAVWRSNSPVVPDSVLAAVIAPQAPAAADADRGLTPPVADHPASPYGSDATPAFTPPQVVVGPADSGPPAAGSGPGGEVFSEASHDPCGSTPHCWIAADYLLWRVKDAPLPVPLVTKGLNNVEFSGAVGEFGTQILYGNQTMDFGSLSGARFAGGWWFDDHDVFGVEAGGFCLQQQTERVGFGSGPGGFPLLGIPFFNTETNTEDFADISVPGELVGKVDVASSIRFWGVESNLAFNLYRDCHGCFDVLAGFRYQQLEESLEIDGASAPLDGSTVNYRGLTFPAPAITTLSDRYRTYNDFAGGQLGFRTEWDRGNLCLRLTGKVALGNTHETVDVAGSSSLFAGPAGPTNTVPGGLFAQTSNSGRFSSNDFTVVPEGDVTVGYRLTRRLRAFAGYQFTYWSHVVRPGDQINRNVNPTQVPTFSDVVLPSTQPAASPLFQTTDFWAYGIHLGLELSF